ncbi:MAG: amidase family protein, partial [Afipia sp.]|nr:amidase family protein [Afipia sp.]
GPQITAVSGPIARTVGDVRLALHAMAQRDVRDPWWVPAPLEGPARRKHAAICLRPGGLETVKEVTDAVVDAGKRLEREGWSVEEITEIPPFEEAAELQVKLWLADGYDAMLDAAEREGDPGALAVLRGHEKMARAIDLAAFSKALTRRATLVRAWETFFETYAVIVMPPCGELPFPWQLDLKDDASFRRVWRAQMPQIALPFIGMPGLTVSTGLVGRIPVGVQIVAGRYREDLCLLAGEAIEAGGVPASPIDPVLA